MKNRLSILILLSLFVLIQQSKSQEVHYISPEMTYLFPSDFAFVPGPGDTLKVMADRTKGLKINGLEGSEENPIVIINDGGQVDINITTWGALELKNCNHIKVTGTGDINVKYGFKLQGKSCGLAFTEYSSDCEAEYVEIAGVNTPKDNGEDSWTFFGIYAKKDFGGTPPEPYPQFRNLIIHDTYIHDVHEGMYLGETKSPGMEFIGMRVYNNVVVNTYKEAIQIANSVQDIEIYNNFLMNSGRAGDFSHTNILQIGDNSQGRVYNNILIECPTYGVTVFGTGQIEISNNYFENTRGIFCDDRLFTFSDAEMHIHNNYFRNTKTGDNDFQIIKYYNQYMDLYASYNTYDTPDEIIKWGFINSIVGDPALDLENNFLPVDQIEYDLFEGIFFLNELGPEAYIGMGPPPGAAPVPEISRIILDPAMVTDMYMHPEVWSAAYLVDEQELDPFEEEHPTSKYWMPGRNKNKGPYHAIIDLGSIHYIEDLYIHDLMKEGDITISYFVDDQWVDLFTDPCFSTDQWNHHKVQIQAQQIRLSMYSSLKARINEIAMYGYSLPGSKSGKIEDNSISTFQKNVCSESYMIFPNPASNHVSIQTTIDNIQNEILDYQGRVVFTSRDKHLDVAELANGVYFLRIRNLDNGNLHISRLVVSH